ncbi:hypothetical protein niasHT_031997 [Heterodera trifolii]|uniref:Uncharacterized protein n=1 Tax=Heterodera trifolii TaxID=157864 RepID=A0ABD2I635_9BILA
MPSSNSFYVIVPSNTNVEGNRTNSFRVRLPRKLQFNSEWDVGLGVIIYPHSWPSLGTSEDQFVQIEWKIGENVQIPIPSSNVTNPVELWKSLYKLLEEGNKPLAIKVEGVQKKFTEAANTARQLGRAEYIKKQQQQQRDKRNVNDDEDEEQLLNALLAGVDTLLDLYGATSGGLLEREKRAATSKVPLRNWDDTEEEYQKKLDKYFSRLRGSNLERLEGLITEKLNAEIALMDDEKRKILDQTKELGMTAWIKIFQSAYSACFLHFDSTTNRFSLKLDDRYVQKIKISDQLAYILGFNSTDFTEKETVAKFMPDMSGGVASFHVYAPDLIEPMMIGDVIAPVLRIVTIRGKPDEIIEEQFLSAQYHRVLVKEINQIPAGAATPVPYSMVINVDPSGSPGSHWVAVYCEQQNRRQSWTDLSRIYLFLDLSIEKPDVDGNWVSITATDAQVGTIQGIGQTFVQQLKVSVGNTEIYDSGNLYPYKLQLVTMRHAHTTASVMKGFKARCKIFEGGKRAQFLSSPGLDLVSTIKTLEKQTATYAVRKTEINFIRYNVKADVAVYAGGMIYPIVPYKLDFAKDIYVRPFVDMYEALGMANSERSFDITKEQFKSGWTFFVIPLTSTLDDSTGYELLRSGTTSIRATFNSAIPEGGVEMIVLGEFDQMIMIDKPSHCFRFQA